MFEPVFKLRTFGRSPALNETILCALLEALTRINVAAMREFRVRPIYRAGLVYQREPLCRYCEEWRDCLSVIEHGGGDCEDLAVTARRSFRYRACAHGRTCASRGCSRTTCCSITFKSSGLTAASRTRTPCSGWGG